MPQPFNWPKEMKDVERKKKWKIGQLKFSVSPPIEKQVMFHTVFNKSVNQNKNRSDALLLLIKKIAVFLSLESFSHRFFLLFTQLRPYVKVIKSYTHAEAEKRIKHLKSFSVSAFVIRFLFYYPTAIGPPAFD